MLYLNSLSQKEKTCLTAKRFTCDEGRIPLETIIYLVVVVVVVVVEVMVVVVVVVKKKCIVSQ